MIRKVVWIVAVIILVSLFIDLSIVHNQSKWKWTLFCALWSENSSIIWDTHYNATECSFPIITFGNMALNPPIRTLRPTTESLIEDSAAYYLFWTCIIVIYSEIILLSGLFIWPENTYIFKILKYLESNALKRVRTDMIVEYAGHDHLNALSQARIQ
jgi:hypothetical protein